MFRPLKTVLSWTDRKHLTAQESERYIGELLAEFFTQNNLKTFDFSLLRVAYHIADARIVIQTPTKTEANELAARMGLLAEFLQGQGVTFKRIIIR